MAVAAPTVPGVVAPVLTEDMRTERDDPRAAPPVPEKEAARRSWAHDAVGRNPGALAAKAVYLSQCHGWIWYDSLGGFSTQRPNLFSTVEDLHNTEGANQFLTAYLENAGAQVFTAKERDHQRASDVVDDGGGGYSESGSGFVDGASGFLPGGPFAYGENPFAMGSTRKFPATGGGKATWRPIAPVDGFYAVYVSWDSDAGNATRAHYRVTHPGGAYDRYFDQTVHGSTWQYVDTLWLPAGESLAVELIGDTTETGRSLSADAVRIGGGLGEVERHGETTGRPRFEEGAILYAQYNGAPSSIYDPYGDGNGSDPPTRSRWADWEHPSGEDAVYLSWHSNAGGGGTARGTSTYSYAPSGCSAGAPVAGSADLAEVVQDEIVSAATLLWDSGWVDRGTHTDCFAENNPAHNDEMPSALVELAFHDSETDARFLKDPAFRQDAARAMYRGIVRYFAERDGVAAKYLPEPPVEIALVHGSDGRLRLSWAPGLAGFPYGDAAVAYRVYTSRDGRSWDNGVDVSGTSTTLDTAAGDLVFARVVATNAGGWSFPSEIVAARRSSDGRAPALIVAAFDRLDGGLLPVEDIDLGDLGAVVRLDMPQVNGGDVAIAPARSIDAMGWPFDTVSDEALDAVDLGDYRVVVWSAGEESTADESFSAAQQADLRAFWEGGGALFVSGAEILWDLDARGTTEDRAFAAEVLGASMASDDAGTERAEGTGLLADLDLSFGRADGAPAAIEWPDVLQTDRAWLATYDSGGVAGAYGERVAMFGLPFEAIGDPSVRDEVMARLLPVLVPDYEPPVDDPDDTDLPDDTDVPDDTDLPEDTGLIAGGGPGTRMFAESAAGCGCDAGGGRGVGGLAAALALAVARRRRSSPGRAGGPDGHLG